MRNEVVEFKSLPHLYGKEEFGMKPNTVRKLPIGDEREEKLRIWAGLVDYGQIAITNTKTKDSFIRNVTDVTIFEGLCIISWEHPKNKEIEEYKKYASKNNDLIEDLGKQLQTLKQEKEDIFKEIENFIKEFDIEYKLMLDSEKWKDFKQKHKMRRK